MNKALRLFLALIIIFVENTSYGNSNDLVVSVMKMARENITNAKLSDGSFVPPETLEEKQKPIISFEDAKRVVRIGQQSGIAAWCSVEWEESSFRAFMQSERKKSIWTDKQLAYIGLVHGITMGLVERTMEENKHCSTKQAQHIRQIIDRK